ncbi:MAG: signal peptidase I [Candidatus Aquicultor sp.]
MTRYLTSIKQSWRKTSLRDRLLSGLVMALIAAFVVFFASAASGRVGLLIVKSGSMRPHMPPGSLLVFKALKFEDVRDGQIVVFRDGKSPDSLVTHRAVEKVYQDGSAYIRTQGDSNHRPDTGLVAKDELMGRAVWVIPVAGYILAFTKTPMGLLALNLSLAFLVLLLVIDKVRAAERAAFINETGMTTSELINPSGNADTEALDCS